MVRVVWAMMGCVGATLVYGGSSFVIGLVYRSPRFVAFCFRLWARWILFACGACATVVGAQHLTPGEPVLLVGNHQSALDIPLLLAALRGHCRFLAKRSLFRIPLFGWVLTLYGFVPIDRENARAARRDIEAWLDRLRKKPVTMVIFPEGTRSPDGSVLPFRRGTMKICQRAGLVVVPFAIDGTRAVYDHRRGRQLAPGPIRVRFMEPISAAEVAAVSSDELNDRIRSAVLDGLDGLMHSQP